MARVGRLKAHNVNAELGFLQPERQFTAEFALAFRRVEMCQPVERMARKGRSPLASDHQHETITLHPARGEKMQQCEPGVFQVLAMKIDPGFGFHLAATKFLRRAAFKTGKLGRMQA